ncbi:MAG TPA: serine/threonine-protein kinase [Gemmataceae bacterium]|nr:serine/threonine-protein kinase [Gemmataceae bacterium]
MTAPDDDTLRRYLLGQLPADEAGTVEAFIDTHPDAADALRSIPAEDGFTAALRGRTAEPTVAPEAEVLARWLEQLPVTSPDADRTRTLGDAESDPEIGRAIEDVCSFLSPAQGPGELGRLGDYRILGILGRGGMGVVFEAEDMRLGRRVAVKAMRQSVALSPTAKARFIREAKAAAAVEHDHVIPIHLIGEERGVPFLVMPFLKGESLEARLKREPVLPVAEVLRIGREVAEGLAAAHDSGLIHRDIKPGNIWLEGPAGRVKILDFGLARPHQSTAADITQSGTVVGTPAFMSPEQGRGQSVDARTDLFSLGGVLYRMATGQNPFHGTDAVGVLMSLAADTPRDPRTLNPHVPPRLASLILWLLDKDAARRPPSAREVARLLTPGPVVEPLPGADRRTEFEFDADEGDAVPNATPSRPARRVRRGLLVGVVAALALLVGGGVAGYKLFFETKDGTLMVEVADNDTEARFKNGELQLLDSDGKVKYTLKPTDRSAAVAPGDYLVKVVGADGLQIETREFTMTKRGQVTVRVTAVPKAVAAKPTPKKDPASAPPKDLFAGELTAYETFDDPARTPAAFGSKGAPLRVKNGAYVAEWTAGKAGDFAATHFGKPNPDLGFVVRFRATNTRVFTNYLIRSGPGGFIWVSLLINPPGDWTVTKREELAKGPEAGKQRVQVLAKSDRPVGELAGGGWVTIRGRAVGTEFELWANEERMVQATVPNYPDGVAEWNPGAVEIGGEVAVRGPAKLEFDHVAVWSLPRAEPKK